jgi:hypothetical protein
VYSVHLGRNPHHEEEPMPVLTEQRTVFGELEKLLRQHEMQICAEVAERYRQSATEPKHAFYAQIGTKYFHDLVVVATALYPSETGIRLQFQWAASGALRREGVDYVHHAAMLNMYFAAARRVTKGQQQTRAALDQVEQLMQRILTEVFNV